MGPFPCLDRRRTRLWRQRKPPRATTCTHRGLCANRGVKTPLNRIAQSFAATHPIHWVIRNQAGQGFRHHDSEGGIRATVQKCNQLLNPAGLPNHRLVGRVARQGSQGQGCLVLLFLIAAPQPVDRTIDVGRLGGHVWKQPQRRASETPARLQLRVACGGGKGLAGKEERSRARFRPITVLSSHQGGHGGWAGAQFPAVRQCASGASQPHLAPGSCGLGKSPRRPPLRRRDPNPQNDTRHAARGSASCPTVATAPLARAY